MKVATLPTELINVWVKYRKDGLVVIKRGFYSTVVKPCFSIPPEWRVFQGSLMPHGFGGDLIPVDQVISWEYCKDEENEK